MKFVKLFPVSILHILYKKMFFGKFKNLLVKDVLENSPSYLEWIMNNHYFYWKDFQNLIKILCNFINTFDIEAVGPRTPTTVTVKDKKAPPTPKKQPPTTVCLTQFDNRPFKDIYKDFIDFEAKRNPRPQIGAKIGSGKSLLEVELDKYVKGVKSIMGLNYLVCTTNRPKSFFEHLAFKFKSSEKI
jgi:hypothetical protein